MAVETAPAPFKRKVFRPYRVREGMFAWMAHRLSGLALVGYLAVHIWGLKALSDRDAYNALIASYHGWIFKVGEFLLWAAVVYHMINGLRIVLIDFLGWSPHQRRLFWTLGAVAVLMIIAGGYPSIYALVNYFAR
jgi:succinate dehydrogenase / fumarate reductase cytochrome b subunit